MQPLVLVFIGTFLGGIFVFGELLYSRGFRVILAALFVPALVLFSAHTVDKFQATIGDVAALLLDVTASVLICLLLLAPWRFFWAFKILCAGVFSALSGMAAWNTLHWISRPGFAATSSDILMNWVLALVFGLPFLWLALKYQPPPRSRGFHLLLEQPFPGWDGWQKSLVEYGFDLDLRSRESDVVSGDQTIAAFLGIEVRLHIEIGPVSRLVKNRELDVAAVAGLDEAAAAVSIGFDDDDGEEAALVAAAALTKITGGRLYPPKSEHWMDGDHALEAAQDIMLPLELYVLFPGECELTPLTWGEALAAEGIHCDIREDVNLKDFQGFIRGTHRNAPIGFLYSGLPAEFVIGGDRFPADDVDPGVLRMSTAAMFRFAERPPDYAVEVAAAVLAVITQGFVYDPLSGTIRTGSESLESAKLQHDQEPDSWNDGPSESG